ncbi:ANTAR domain-containing response regulator [Geopsychrobacter electrodiphilus]|uniref:ANTAR domain-containing response regulator n=1 Tax=Geopsychrobacter electrodiphilus TaxID=225196 RepID=UPI000369EF02|nr:response regulator [Geopsychrobacter electrodiphilus]
MKIALIADDEPLIRRQVAECLSAYGFDRVVEAENGAQAATTAAIEKPLLIVLDVNMPVMDGMTAAEKIRQTISAPIILLTGNTDAETIARARDVGVSNYLLKPFHAEQMKAAVELAIHRFIEISNLQDENTRLKEALETRKLVDKAKGLLIGKGMSEPDAYRKMQKIAMDKRKSLKEVAEAILLMES